MGKPKSQKVEEDIVLSKKDLKKVTKLESQIPYHDGRGNKDEVEKIRNQVEKIWTKTRDAHYAAMQ